MLGATPNQTSIFDRFAFRLTVLLSIALLPLGIIAVSQTYAVIEEARGRSEVALLGLTAEAASSERQLIQRGFGAALAIGSIFSEQADDDESCAPALARFVGAEGVISAAAFIDVDGQVVCSSNGIIRDYSEDAGFLDLKANPRPLVRIDRLQEGRGTSLVVILQPIYQDETLVGLATVSLPHRGIFGHINDDEAGRPIDLVTFNAEGDVLSASGGLTSVERRLPADRSLAAFTSDESTAFTAENRAGEPRVFAIVPIVEGSVYAMGSWPPESVYMGTVLPMVAGLSFPLLMWVVSLIVAYFAVHRLVTRHVRAIRRNMRRFAAGHRILPPLKLKDAPVEFREMGETFLDMVDKIIRNDAELENTIHEKEVLLREVHHRVKNNLQLISSIINMQIRQAHSKEAKLLLRRIQDRVMSLATIHKALYLANTFSRLQVDDLLEEVVSKLLAFGAKPGQQVQLRSEIAPITLYPDQAVPLALLVTEATTNALKYLGQGADGSGHWVELSLEELPDREARLTISNSKGEAEAPVDPDTGSGLGTQLIEAFVMQLDGTIERTETGDRFQVVVTFPISDFGEEDDLLPARAA